jgi:outer membrane lipoprotein-sorting protein
MKIRLMLALLMNALFVMQSVNAQDANVLFKQLKAQWERVVGYEAEGVMKTRVGYLKIPPTPIKLQYQKPDQMRLLSDKGVTFLPKGVAMLNMSQLFSDPNAVILDAGITEKNKRKLTAIKIIPNDPKSQVVLATLWVDPSSNLIMQSSTTTRDQGTIELEMTYGKYRKQGLPDQILFTFDARSFKLPKGVTFDFEPGGKPAKTANSTNSSEKSTVLITLNKYRIQEKK